MWVTTLTLAATEIMCGKKNCQPAHHTGHSSGVGLADGCIQAESDGHSHHLVIHAMHAESKLGKTWEEYTTGYLTPLGRLPEDWNGQLK